MRLLQIDINLQNVADSQGLGIALTGMVIVFLALILITLFITFLPKVLAAVTDTAAPQASELGKTPAAGEQEDEEIVAAIGYVLHHHSQGHP